MTLHRPIYVSLALGKNLVSLKGGTAMLSSFGALYTIVNISDRFAPSMTGTISALWWLFLIAGFGFAALLCWPKLSTKCTLDGRDVSIEIRIGDLFKTPGALIVATNTTFDTRISSRLIDENSVQGQFTKKYLGTAEALDVLLDAALQHERTLAPIEVKHLPGPREGKCALYPMGTTVRIEPKGVTAYLFAMADMNSHGRAVTTPNDVKTALAKLWNYVGERGTQSALVTPVIASKFGQMTLTRETLIKVMIRSFVAACSERTFCERLVIVISDADARRHKIDMASLEAFLQHTCRYSDFERDDAPAVGTPVGDVRPAGAATTEIVALGSPLQSVGGRFPGE